MDAPDPIEEVQAPECDGDADPIEDPDSDSPIDEDQARATGMLVHIRSGRVHLCGNGGVERTKCGIVYSDALELKLAISEFDLRCAMCFRLPTVSLLGRQGL